MQRIVFVAFEDTTRVSSVPEAAMVGSSSSVLRACGRACVVAVAVALVSQPVSGVLLGRAGFETPPRRRGRATTPPLHGFGATSPLGTPSPDARMVLPAGQAQWNQARGATTAPAIVAMQPLDLTNLEHLWTSLHADAGSSDETVDATAAPVDAAADDEAVAKLAESIGALSILIRGRSGDASPDGAPKRARTEQPVPTVTAIDAQTNRGTKRRSEANLSDGKPLKGGSISGSCRGSGDRAAYGGA